jgi:hypothetical protein
METNLNHEDKSQEELNEEQKNKAASEKMDANEERENQKFQQNQNRLTQSEDPEQDDASLLNNNEDHQSKDSLSLGEQNKRKLEGEQDQDFGSEQIK